MTTKMYLIDSSLQGTATVEQIGFDGRPWICLDQTLFHPQGGGQKADTGTINGVFVSHVAHKGEDVVHYINDTSSLQVGQKVTLQVDAACRLTNAKLHTAGHLLAAIGEMLITSCKAVSGHHWPGEARVEFTFNSAINADEISKQLTSAVNEAIRCDAPITIVGDPFSSRSIQIGDFPPVPCGGTHLSRLGLLEKVEITKVKVKGGLIRASYKL